jgi:predicted anti-sigma-YlaC factor YlaD
MLKCDKYEALIMRYFDHDFSGNEREKLDQHLDSCSNCRLLFSQLSGILNTLENAKAAEPEPHLERLVMDRIMSLPAPPDNKEQCRPVKLIYGMFAGIVALLLLVISLVLQDSGFPELVLTGKYYLDMFSSFVVDLQIVYQIVAGVFPSEMFSLVLTIQFIFIASMLMLAFVAMKTAFNGPTGGHPDVS